MKLHVSSVTPDDLFSFIPSIPTYWHQEETWGCTEFSEPNYLLKWHVFILAYPAITLQASWHIADDN